jgi:hypothetical protein
LPDLQADRGLRQAQVLGRRRKTATCNDLGKGMEVVQVQTPHLKVFLILTISDHSFILLSPNRIMSSSLAYDLKEKSP